jgi:hypothetical protein
MLRTISLRRERRHLYAPIEAAARQVINERAYPALLHVVREPMMLQNVRRALSGDDIDQTTVVLNGLMENNGLSGEPLHRLSLTIGLIHDLLWIIERAQLADEHVRPRALRRTLRETTEEFDRLMAE